MPSLSATPHPPQNPSYNKKKAAYAGEGGGNNNNNNTITIKAIRRSVYAIQVLVGD